MKEVNGTRSQNRRDFRADFECEGCGNIDKDKSGYDDNYFHTSVIPSWKCSECGESTVSLKAEIADKTVVPAHVTI